MTRKIFVAALIFLVGVTIFSAADAKTKTTWRLDGTSSGEVPRSFRTFDALKISGSAQPSIAALTTLYEKLHGIDPDAKIFMVDLRQETHGFANDVPVSLHTKHNAINAGKNSAQVERIEAKVLRDLRGVETTFVPLGNSDTKILRPLTIIPHVVKTERDAAEVAGFDYVRFAAADMQFPAPEIVDDFVQFVAALPENSWLHFHCHAGHGRTTTFMVMYEILRDPNQSLEEICQRQKNSGGSDILETASGNDWNARATNDRAKKIRLFYEFVQGTRAERIGLQWSEWLAEVDR